MRRWVVVQNELVRWFRMNCDQLVLGRRFDFDDATPIVCEQEIYQMYR